ncbi:MAG: amidohydrolase family protein [Phycisphaerales bacterium]|nr:amidohydrolase family protein [Phycisphaerales bacterium]
MRIRGGLVRGVLAMTSVVALIVGGGCRSSAPAAVVATIDHHVHIIGPGLLRDWASVGVEFSHEPAHYATVSGLMAGTSAGGSLRRAVLVPMAHLYGNDEFREAMGLTVDEEARRVAAENDHVAADAARFPGRATPLCAVDFRRPYALDEIIRCRRDHPGSGIKLHFASAGFDFRDEAAFGALERIMALAASDGIPVLVHLDPQHRGLEAEDVRRVIDRLLLPHPDLVVNIAHLGGSGGCGPWMRTVMGTFHEWLDEEAAAGRGRPGVYFDISAVILDEPSHGVPASSDEDLVALAPLLREVGLRRIVFGSDHPVFDPQRTAAAWAARSGLTRAELARVLSNRIPGLTEG